jgi:hypothetical protein
MAAVKFDEGTKFETSLELEEGEGIIFAKPPKNRMDASVDDGCLMALLTVITLGIIRIFKPIKRWRTNFVITNKRVVAIPQPPNKKGFPVESYYFKDIYNVRAEEYGSKQSDRMVYSHFVINMKASSSYKEPRKFMIQMIMSAKNILKMIGQTASEQANDFGNQLASYNAQLQTQLNKDEAIRTGASHYIEVIHKVQKMNFSKTSVEDIRDFIIEIINDCIAAANS